MGFLTMLVVGDRSHDQHKHQNGGYRFQGADKNLADKAYGQRRRRGEPGQQNPGNQADHDLGHQAGAFEPVQQGR